MEKRRLIERSKKLSWLLRHGAGEEGLDMDTAGWAPVDEVLRRVRLTRAQLEVIVRENTKGRLQLDGDRVRACQGHSTEHMPVTLDALEASWSEHTGTEALHHGTYRGALESISIGGLVPKARTHVHLTESLASRVGKRANVDIALELDPTRIREAGVRIFRAPNGVILTRRVPREAIVGLVAMTRRAKRIEAELRSVLGL